VREVPRHAVCDSVKTRGNLTTNDGEIAVMRAEWDIERHLQSGRVKQVLPQHYTPDADIHAVDPQHHQIAGRVRAFVDFVAVSLRSARRAASPEGPGSSPFSERPRPRRSAWRPAWRRHDPCPARWAMPWRPAPACARASN